MLLREISKLTPKTKQNKPKQKQNKNRKLETEASKDLKAHSSEPGTGQRARAGRAGSRPCIL